MAKPAVVSIGSFSEVDACALAEAMRRIASIPATVRRLVKDDGSQTDWWLIVVAQRSERTALAWIGAWQAGELHERITRRMLASCLTYAAAAHSLGYLEIMPEGK